MLLRRNAGASTLRLTFLATDRTGLFSFRKQRLHFAFVFKIQLLSCVSFFKRNEGGDLLLREARHEVRGLSKVKTSRNGRETLTMLQFHLF